MTYRIVILPSAQADLGEIDIYLSPFSQSAFERLLTAIEKRCSTLSVFPETGRLFSVGPPKIRVVFIKKYALFYQIDRDTIEIARIIDGRRDLTLLSM